MTERTTVLQEIAQTLPPVPGHGDLNISETLNSLYFFA